MSMDYLYIHPGETIRYNSSVIELHIDSDTAYLVAPKVQSRVAGYSYLSEKLSEKAILLPP